MISRNLSMISGLKAGIVTEILCSPSADLPGCVTRGRKNELWKGLGVRLRLTRTRSAMTPTAVCRAGGVEDETVARLEQLENVPVIDTLERLAAALGVPPGWLAFGSDGYEPFSQKKPRRPLPPDDPRPFSHTTTFRNLSAGCSERVASARRSLGLSMRKLSTAAGISVQTWSTVEAGATVPKADSLERMAVALDVAPAWLAYGDDEPDMAS